MQNLLKKFVEEEFRLIPCSESYYPPDDIIDTHMMVAIRKHDQTVQVHVLCWGGGVGVGGSCSGGDCCIYGISH